MNRSLFLGLLLIDSLFGCVLAAGAIAYQGHVHPVAIVAVAVVLAAFAAGAAACLQLAWTGTREAARLKDVSFTANHLPGLAIIGTGLGFLIALSGDPDQIRHRVAGASSGILATVIGVACWLCLSYQHHLLTRDGE